MKFGNLELFTKRPIIGCMLLGNKIEKTDTIAISTHGLTKKTGKTPQVDLDKVERLRKLDFEQNIRQ